MLDDPRSAGSVVAPYDDGELLRLAELRASSGLKLPDCCVPDVAIHHQASLATFDDTLAAAARTRSVPASTNGAATMAQRHPSLRQAGQLRGSKFLVKSRRQIDALSQL